MKNLYTESSYDRNERPRAFPFYQDYQQNTYFAPNQGTEENLLFDPKGISDPINWGVKPRFTGEPTEAESRTLNQIQSLAFANVLNNSLVTLGTDPSQGLYLRQLIGQAAMQPVAVADEDINEAGIAREQTRLNDLMAQPEDRLQQSGMGDLITQSMSKLAYMKARHNNTLVIPDTNIANYYRGQGWFGNIVGGIADIVLTTYDTTLNFNFGLGQTIPNAAVPGFKRMVGDGLRVLRSMGFDNTELLADIEKETGGLPSTSTADMVALVESFDRNFDYKTWFNETIALDPTMRDGLLNYGVTEDLFVQSRNSTHALMTLMSKMNVSDIQRRLSNYVPTTYQSIYGFAASFKDGLVGSLDTAGEIALELGGTVAMDAAIGAGLASAPTAGALAPVGAVVGGVVGLAQAGRILYKGLSAAKKVMSSAWYLTGYGKLPRYAMQWGVIRTTGASALVGATSNSLIDYVGQKENIALANSLYFYNPDMQATVSMDEVVGAAAAGALFGASLGMVGHVISTVAVRGNNAAARNAFAMEGIDPAFAPQQRNPFQRTKDNIAAFRNRKAVAIQDPISGAIQTAVSKGADPTVVDINSAARTTSTAIDAASVASTPKDAANLPDHSLNRRQANEPMKAFTIRAVLGKFVTSINDLLDADSAGGRFSLLTPREQYLTLLRSEDNMRTFADMTAFEENAVNTAAGKLIPTVTVDPLTGRADNPSANVAKLYAELDAHRSTLDKTISKEDRAEAISAHKNGTELAPRTISSAVDKATSNARGIMENASEGRHNPSEAKGPKVESQATPGSPATGNAAQGTTAPALPTQKKVDEITQDTAEDMSLLTDEELEDQKVTGAIERNVTRQLFGGQKEHTLRSLSRGLAKARKLTPEQQKNINASLDNPRSFLKNATGNKTYIKNFFNRLDQLVTLGHITDVDRRIILASTVNTKFNSNVAAKISDMGTRADDRASTSLQGDIKIGKLDTSVAGNTRVENVLHEIGHVEELHAYGSSLMDMRKLFTSEQAFLDAAQEVLGTDNFNKYYLAGNTQELMAQVKAKMMIDEVKLAVFLKTANSTAMEKTLLHRFLSVGTTLVEVFNSLKLSKVDAEDQMYSAVKNVLSQLEKNSGPLMTRVNYQNRVAEALKEFPKGKLSPADKVAFTKAINEKISEGFTKNSAELKDMLFTKDDVQSLHALTVHTDGSIDPIRLDAYLNVKREGITVKSKAKFAKTFQSYVEINQRYLASTTDIYIASMKENGYKAVPSNPIVMDASLSKRDQIAALREYHRELTPDEMVVTPSYMDVTFGNFNGDLALQFLIDSSTEPTVMFAPMEGFVSKLRTMIGINTDTLESLVGGVDIDPSHIGKALQMLTVNKMLTIEQIKVKLAAAEMVVALNPFCVEQLSTIKSKAMASGMMTTTVNAFTSWVEKTVSNLSVSKRDNAMTSLSSILDDLTLRLDSAYMQSRVLTAKGIVTFNPLASEAVYKTKTIEALVSETKQWANDLRLINAGEYAPTKPENVVMEVTFGDSAKDRANNKERSIAGTTGTWQKVYGTDINIEGKKMNHCILRYKESIDSGRTDVYSLRDADNNPIATVGIKYDGTTVFDAAQYENQIPLGVMEPIQALLAKLGVTKYVTGGTVARMARDMGLTHFDLDAYKAQKIVENLLKDPKAEENLIKNFLDDAIKNNKELTSVQTAYITANSTADGQVSPNLAKILKQYIEKFNEIPNITTNKSKFYLWYSSLFEPEHQRDKGILNLMDHFVSDEFKHLEDMLGGYVETPRQNFLLDRYFASLAHFDDYYPEALPQVAMDKVQEILLKNFKNIQRSPQTNSPEPTFRLFPLLDNVTQQKAITGITKTSELPMVKFFQTVNDYIMDYEFEELANSKQARIPRMQMDAAKTALNAKKNATPDIIREAKQIAIAELTKTYGWAAPNAFAEFADSLEQANYIVRDPRITTKTLSFNELLDYPISSLMKAVEKSLKEDLGDKIVDRMNHVAKFEVKLPLLVSEMHIENDFSGREFSVLNLAQKEMAVRELFLSDQMGIIEAEDLVYGNPIPRNKYRQNIRYKDFSGLSWEGVPITLSAEDVRKAKLNKVNSQSLGNAEVDRKFKIRAYTEEGIDLDMAERLVDDADRAFMARINNRMGIKQPPVAVANDLFAPQVKKTPATKAQVKFVKNSVISSVLRHSSTLPNGIKLGLDGGESSLGAGVYLSPDLGDARNYPTDVYVNITKPLVIDTAAYLQGMTADPRVGYVPFSSTANVFNHRMATLMQQFIAEKGLVVDPSWLKNLAENMVQPMRDIPQVVKEALDLTDGQWHKSYSRAGVDQSIHSNVLDESVLLKAGDDVARQEAIIAQHNNDSSVTVSAIAEPRIVAHRLMQRMGYDGVVAKNFQSFDYNGKALAQGKDMYVALDTKAIMPQEEMFAPKVKSSVAYTPELVVQRLAFLSTNLKDAPATAADFKKAMQGMLGMNDELFDSLAKVKEEVSLEQMADYHQMVIRRVVKNLMEEKIAVGPEGVRRLNLVEREMNLVRASKQTEGTKAAKLERARTEPVEDMPVDTTDSKLYPNNPMNSTMLENFWQDPATFKQVAARLKASSSLNDQGVLDAILDAMLKVKDKGVAILVDAKGEVRSRNAVINYIVVSAKNANFDAKGLKASRAGLTPDSWKDFLETENDILRSSGKEEITFNGTPTQHIAAEKKKGSELYARFKKAYTKSYMEVGEDGAVTGATSTKAAEPSVAQVKAQGFDILLNNATRLDYNLFSTRDGGWQKFVAGHHADGKSYGEIVALGKESGFPNKKAGNVADAIYAIRRKYRNMMEEKTGISTEGMTNDEVQASGVLDSIEEQAQAADATREIAPVEDLAPERKSSSEILAETEKSATEQTNSDELTAALDTKEPTSQPVISPEGSKGPVTAVVQVDGEAVGPLTPHVAPKTAEAVVKGSKTPKARFTSSTPKKVAVFTTGDARAMLKATGNVGKLFFASMKTMEGLLNALPKSALKDTDIAATLKILKKMVAAGEEKAAVAKFLALMKHLDIEAVKVIDPKDGRVVMNFIFAEKAWSYGGISRFKTAPKKATAAPKKTAAEPKTAEPKTAEPKTAEAAPVDTPTEAAPDGTQVPVIEPKEVPSNEIAGGTVVPVVSEHDRIVTGLTEGNEALRDGGVDATSFTALFKKFVRSLSKDDKKKLGTVLPEEFKDLFMKFVELNAAIMHDNRTLFGDHKIVGKFWKQVDEMLAVEDGLQMKDTMRIRLTMREIYAMASAQVSTKNHRFLPPLTHENITIKNGKFGLRDVSKETQGVLARRDTGPIIAYTPEEIAARKTSAAAAKPAEPIGPVTPPKQAKRPPTVKEMLDETFNPENDPKVAAEAEAILQDSDRLDSIFEKVSASFSQLLRQNNLISWIFGGSERANRNRWRAFMSKTVGAIQHGSKLGSTIRAMDAKVRFFAMFMDDSRAMTGQLVSPDGTPIRSAAKSKQEAVMFTANLTRIHHALAAEAAVLKMTPAERKLLQRLQIEAWQRKTTPTAQEMSAAFGGKDFGKMAGILENYRKEMLHLNTEMLKLEEKTGWRSVTKNGKPVEADAYLPVQLHIQKLMSVMGDNKAYEALLKSVVTTRRAGKLADSMLDRNTLITMGIMNLEDNSKFYTQDRTFALTNNITLDADTLKKLKKFEVVTTESTDFVKTLGKNGRDFFIITTGDKKATVYMMPTETKHLSDADLKKYLDTVSGDQTHVTKTWKNELDNKDLISVEMKELLDFKSRQGRYHHTKNTMINNRPTIDANHHDEAFSTVRNFSVDELISNKELFEVSRTDLHAAYQNFSRYRMFDLLFQESIDQLSGSTGLRPKEFFRLIEEKIKADADKMSQGMSIDNRAALQADIDAGIGRLVWQYAEYNGTITRSGSESRIGQNIARTVRGIATTSAGLGYGLSQSPETTMEIIKNMPQTKGLSVPVGGFKYLASLFKFWDRKDSATKMQVGDLITSLEEYSKDHSTHFNEGIADVDFDTDLNAPYRAIWNSGRNSEGLTGKTADFFSRTGQTAVLAGGVTDGTNLARYYGKARHVRDLTAMMRDGKLKEFLRLRALPENRAAMQKLLEGSFASAAEERKLWKMHKSLARQAKGLDPFLALKAIKVGLDNPAKLEAMMYGMNAANALDGVLDFRDLHMVYRDLKNMKSPPIDPELYRAAATDFQYGVEALIRKRTVTHGFGLNKNLSVFNTQDEVGKLVNTLTSYMRSWFDDVALNAPERGAVGLMFGGILSVAVVESIITLLREWMSGREMEDMVAEMEQDPMEYVIKFATRMPVFGVMTPVFEGAVKTVKYMSGGAQSGGSGLIDTLSQVGGGSPNIGINSAMSMLKTTGEAGTDLVTGAMEGDTQLMAKGALRVPGHFFNKTIYAAPVRIMEEQMDLDDKHTAQFIIDGLQKKPYRYLSQQRGGRRGGFSRAAPQSPVATPVTTQTMPQSAALRNAQRPDMGRQVKEYVAPAPSSKPNSGVSERLGKLLDNPSYTPTPPM